MTQLLCLKLYRSRLFTQVNVFLILLAQEFKQPIKQLQYQFSSRNQANRMLDKILSCRNSHFWMMYFLNEWMCSFSKRYQCVTIVTRNNIFWKLVHGYCLCYCKTFSLVPDSSECTKIFLTEKWSTLFVTPKIK